MAKSKLEEEYEEMLLSDVEECKRQLKYNPKEFVHLVIEHGGVRTTLQLIVPGAPPSQWASGFHRLYDEGRLDLSLEAGLRDRLKFHPLFAKEIIEECDRRLKMMNYTPPSQKKPNPPSTVNVTALVDAFKKAGIVR